MISGRIWCGYNVELPLPLLIIMEIKCNVKKKKGM